MNSSLRREFLKDDLYFLCMFGGALHDQCLNLVEKSGRRLENIFFIWFDFGIFDSLKGI
jgi:hypothetical protein